MKHMLFRFLKDKKGISMPELMAGITIMSILAGTGVTNAIGQISHARLAATMDEMKSISEALLAYQQDHPGDTISTITTLVSQGYLTEGFTEAPDTDLETDWKEDAWGLAYTLLAPSVDTDGDYLRGYLKSAGSDGKMIDDPATSGIDETDDNIRITLEAMVPSD